MWQINLELELKGEMIREGQGLTGSRHFVMLYISKERHCTISSPWHQTTIQVQDKQGSPQTFWIWEHPFDYIVNWKHNPIRTHECSQTTSVWWCLYEIIYYYLQFSFLWFALPLIMITYWLNKDIYFGISLTIIIDGRFLFIVLPKNRTNIYIYI